MKKIIVSIFVISNLLFGGMNNNNTIDYGEFDKIPSSELTRSIANEFAKNLPLQIDYLTTMTNIFGLGNSVITKKQINIKHKDINNFWKSDKNELIKAMYKLDSQNICYEPIWQYLIMKRNIIAEFNYVDTDNKPLFNYTVESLDCKKII
jgi:hypothetical protein